MNDIFTKECDVYIASADRMDKIYVNKNVIDCNYKQGAYSYASVIGGMSGLNYISQLKPSHITFFDINETMTQYCKFILELISICKNHSEFITRIFCRDVDSFNISHQLNYTNQEKYLQIIPDKNILNDTIHQLTKRSAQIYSHYIIPYHSGQPLEQKRNCRILLPCWRNDEVVPVGAGQAFGHNKAGELVPNVNTFFYGEGWLSSKEAFVTTKEIIQSSKIDIKNINILESGINTFIQKKYALALHTSNIDDWFPIKFQKAKHLWSQEANKQQADLLLITSNNGVFRLNVENHCVAFEAIRKWITGSTIELTTKNNWGFNEIIRQNLLITEYIQNNYECDTIIFHIIIGEGVSISTFKSALQKAIKHCMNIIILEHNKDSLDWRNHKTPMLSTIELVDLIKSIIINSNLCIHNVQSLPGERDHQRNNLVVLRPLK